MLRLIIAVGIVALLAPPVASASTLSFSGDVLTYTAAANEENNLSTSVPEAGFCSARPDPCLKVSEGSGVVITSFPADSCTATDSASVVECRVPASMVVQLGDRDDTLFDWNGPSTVDGSSGNDGLDGNAGNDVLTGGAGADALRGEAGDDRLDGGDGDDSFEGFGVSSSDTENDTSGRDDYAGGPGTDLVDYTGRADPLVITLDGASNDGGAGEGDRVGPDVERVYGGAAGDALTGNASDNWLYGYGGDDILTGGAGADMLLGGVGADRLTGEEGDDGLEGEDGGDRLDGGSGVDHFDGDGIFSGADTILARDGIAETIACGAGSDHVVADKSDTTLGFGACERVDREDAAPGTGDSTAAPGAGDTTGSPGAGDTTTPTLGGLRATAGRRGRLRVRLNLSEPATLTLRLQRRRGGRYRTVPGQVRHAGVKGANVLRVNGRLRGRRLAAGRYRLVVTAVDAAGNRAVRRLSARLRR